MSVVKKHPCPDCHFCQFCSETRCNACRGKGSVVKKMSLQEQIDLFNKLNPSTGKINGPIYYRQCPRCMDDE